MAEKAPGKRDFKKEVDDPHDEWKAKTKLDSVDDPHDGWDVGALAEYEKRTKEKGRKEAGRKDARDFSAAAIMAGKTTVEKPKFTKEEVAAAKLRIKEIEEAGAAEIRRKIVEYQDSLIKAKSTKASPAEDAATQQRIKEVEGLLKKLGEKKGAPIVADAAAAQREKDALERIKAGAKPTDTAKERRDRLDEVIAPKAPSEKTEEPGADATAGVEEKKIAELKEKLRRAKVERRIPAEGAAAKGKKAPEAEPASAAKEKAAPKDAPKDPTDAPKDPADAPKTPEATEASKGPEATAAGDPATPPPLPPEPPKAPEAPKAPEVPKTPEQLKAALDKARVERALAAQHHEDARKLKIGFFGRTKERIFGKKDTLETADAHDRAEKEYQEAKEAYAKHVLGTLDEHGRPLPSNMLNVVTFAEQEKAAYDKLLSPEKHGLLNKAMERYARMPKVARIGISLLISTSAATAVMATGGLGFAAAMSYFGYRAGKAVIGVAASAGATELYGGYRNNKIDKRQAHTKAEILRNFKPALIGDVLKQIEALANEKQKFDESTGRRKALVALGAGGILGLAGAIDSHMHAIPGTTGTLPPPITPSTGSLPYPHPADGYPAPMAADTRIALDNSPANGYPAPLAADSRPIDLSIQDSPAPPSAAWRAPGSNIDLSVQDSPAPPAGAWRAPGSNIDLSTEGSPVPLEPRGWLPGSDGFGDDPTILPKVQGFDMDAFSIKPPPVQGFDGDVPRVTMPPVQGFDGDVAPLNTPGAGSAGVEHAAAASPTLEPKAPDVLPPGGRVPNSVVNVQPGDNLWRINERMLSNNQDFANLSPAKQQWVLSTIEKQGYEHMSQADLQSRGFARDITGRFNVNNIQAGARVRLVDFSSPRTSSGMSQLFEQARQLTPAQERNILLERLGKR